MQIVRLSKRGNSLMITIPRPYLDKLHWGLGDLLVLEACDNRLQVHPLREHKWATITPQTPPMEPHHAEA